MQPQKAVEGTLLSSTVSLIKWTFLQCYEQKNNQQPFLFMQPQKAVERTLFSSTVSLIKWTFLQCYEQKQSGIICLICMHSEYCIVVALAIGYNVVSKDILIAIN
jgi:hypothetical protein